MFDLGAAASERRQLTPAIHMLAKSNKPPKPPPRETVPSFLSRLASWQRVPVHDYAIEMGFSLKRAVVGEEQAIGRLAELGGLTVSELDELLSWSGQRLGDVRMSFRGETFVSRALRNPILRGCPCCLREDAARSPSHPLEAMAYRGDWQLRYQGVCVRHGRTLVPLWTETSVLSRYDFHSRFRALLPDLEEGRLVGEHVQPTAFETWLDRRLETGEDETQMKRFSLYAALECSRLLGPKLIEQATGRPVTRKEEATRYREILNAGFSVVAGGEDAIAGALRDLVDLAVSGNHKAPQVFGQFYEQLARDHLEDPDFAPFRDLLRERILATWPVAPGTDLLGETVEFRRLHSVATASEDTGYNAAPLRKALIDAGALAPDDARPNGLATFDAQEHAGLLEDLPHLVGLHAMADSIGASSYMLKALAQEGLLTPRVSVPGFRAPWKLEDGQAFLDVLLANAKPIAEDAKGWEHVQVAAFRTRLGLRPIVEAIRDGQIAVGSKRGSAGYASAFVRPVDVDGLVAEPLGAMGRSHLTLAEFGRRIGMRNTETLRGMIYAGLMRSTVATTPSSGHTRISITEPDAEDFLNRYTTAAMLAKEEGVRANVMADRLRKRGVSPVMHDGKVFERIYRKRDLL
ncbi:MAG: TniQ family protein [Cyclobacteriaceae bacterium]